MIYSFEHDEMHEPPFLDWRKKDREYMVDFTKNGRNYSASLKELEKSWKLKLIRTEDNKVIIELRFRNLALDDAMFYAESYMMELAE